jgi:hypothetical protein
MEKIIGFQWIAKALDCEGVENRVVMSFIYQWIDALWLPLAFFVVHKPHRWWAVGFVASCMLMLRLQTELMVEIGYDKGILNFVDSPVFSRGLIVYSIIYIIYLILAYYSPGTRGVVFMAASISIFFMSLFISMIVMVL